MPPIARLTPAQAMLTSCRATPRRSPARKRASPSRKRHSPPASARPSCRPPSEIRRFAARSDRGREVDCWLVNTGWTGGASWHRTSHADQGDRALLAAALDGSLKGVEFRTDPIFGFEGRSPSGVDGAILDPRSTWADREVYDRQAKKIVDIFIANLPNSRGMSPSARGASAADPAGSGVGHKPVGRRASPWIRRDCVRRARAF